MDLNKLFSYLSVNQIKLVQSLIDNPSGLLSRELTEITGISNKSGSISKKFHNSLKSHGLELVIERVTNSSEWNYSLRKIVKEKYIPEAKLIEITNLLDKISRLSQEVKILLG